jgi:DNA-binding transcriptional LysR family regulator
MDGSAISKDRGAMLTLRMIEVFRTVILTGSMSEAAVRLHISQPAVSRLIRDLEAKIGFRLFDRRHGRIFANDDAMVFYQEVHRSFIGLERISHAAEKIRSHETGILRIACMPAVALSILPTIITRFRKKNPHVDISLKVVRSETAVHLVSDLHCDIAIVEASFAALSAEEGTTFPIACVCVLPPNHPLAKLDVITPQDLVDEVFISLDPDSKTRFNIDAAFASAGISRTLQLETPMTNMACSLVLEGCGVSIVDPMTAEVFARQGLQARPFEPAATFSIHTLTSPGISGRNLKKEFCEDIEQALTNFSPP